MVTWNTNVPCEDTINYVDEMYFDSEIGYLSCYTVGNQTWTLDIPTSKATSIQLDHSYLLWHYCMGHCSCNALHHVPDHVSGILKLEIPPMPPPCCGCLLSKVHEQPFPPSEFRGVDCSVWFTLTFLNFPSTHGHNIPG